MLHDELEARIKGSSPEDNDEPQKKMACLIYQTASGAVEIWLSFGRYRVRMPEDQMENMEKALLREYHEINRFQKVVLATMRTPGDNGG
jgi:hypothetical protein